MAQNVLPRSIGELRVLGGKCRAGLLTYGTPLNITQITAASLATDIGTLGTTASAFDATRAARTAAHGVLTTASDAAKKFLSDARGILVAHWGDAYSQNWAGAGWIDHTTAVPNSQPGRLSLVNSLQTYLTNNPAFEVDAPPISFTAATATLVGDALDAALAGVGQADTKSDNAKSARTAADTALRRALRALIGILNQKLTPNDARWAAFGLNAPGAAVTPKPPTDLMSHAALPGQAHLTCATPMGTDHFRWFKKGPLDAGYAFVQDTADAELLLEGLTSGETVLFPVTAVNAAGESVPSTHVGVLVG